MAFVVSTARAWPLLSWPCAHLHNPANTYYQARPVITIAPSLVTRHWCRVPSVHGTYYPVLAWSIQLRAYAMPSVPVPPIMLLTDMVTRCRLLTAHGARSCLSVRTQPLTATGAPSQTSTMPCHAMPCSIPSTQGQGKLHDLSPKPSCLKELRFRKRYSAWHGMAWHVYSP